MKNVKQFYQNAETIIEQYNELERRVSRTIHDMGSPLAVIRMSLPQCYIPDDQQDLLDRALTQIYKMKDNLLEYLRFNKNITIQSKRYPSLIHSEILAIITEKEYEYSQQNIKFITNITADSHTAVINVDLLAFQRMMSNLINNAVEASNAKSGQVNIDLNIIDNNQLQIIIADNGCGMPEPVKQKILNNIATTFGKTNGHGIGFEQINDTLRENEGTLAIKSEIGIGTKIILTFPQIDKLE